MKLHQRRPRSGTFDGLSRRDLERLAGLYGFLADESHSESKSSRAGYPQPTAKSGAKKGKPA